MLVMAVSEPEKNAENASMMNSRKASNMMWDWQGLPAICTRRTRKQRRNGFHIHQAALAGNI
jgi:hypothetical protein